ncbi:hypothetical protein GGR51DRAFT_493024 [Nemania sp. FL0031]|nr:hypothetical protein GGR51DRAFT_493024 [Nemania sp. FL0031]
MCMYFFALFFASSNGFSESSPSTTTRMRRSDTRCWRPHFSLVFFGPRVAGSTHPVIRVDDFDWYWCLVLPEGDEGCV